MDMITINGVRCASPSQVRKGVFEFFKDYFASKCIDRPCLEGIDFAHISYDSGRTLDEAFSVEEVRETLKGCDGHKAPGSDGFNVNFIKSN